MMFFAAVPGILITWLILQRLAVRLSPYFIVFYRQLFALMRLLYGLRIKIAGGFGVLLLALTAFIYSKHNYSVQIDALKSECRDLEMAERSANIAKRNKAKKEELENRIQVLEKFRQGSTGSLNALFEIQKIKRLLEEWPDRLWELNDSLEFTKLSYPVSVGDYIEYKKRFPDHVNGGCNLPEFSFLRYLWPLGR